MRGTMVEASVVIPNLNGMKYLKNCLESLGRQSFGEFEIIMVDNGSKDESVSFVKEQYPQVRMIELDRNYGFCHAVNVGIKASTAPYVILLNNDIEADEAFIAELIAGIKRYPGCFSGAAKMIQLHDKSKIDSAGDFYCALGWAFASGKDKAVSAYGKEREVFAACGGAAIYRRDILDEIGYFDEKHFAYLEDVDIGYRAKIYGYSNRYLPKAVVYHAGSGTSGSRYNTFKVDHSSKNSVYLVYKNMPLLQIIINIPFLAAGFLLKQCFFAKKGLGKEYARGIGKGILLSLHGKKVAFKKEHFKNYVKIQCELWENMFRRMSDY